MNISNLIQRLAVIIFIFTALFGSASAQNQPEAVVNFANSTDATLSISIKNSFINYAFRVTIAPLSERAVTVPAGLLNLIVNANRSNPAKGYSVEFTVSSNGRFEYNITPSLFGVKYLTDRPSSNTTGITTNESKTAINLLDNALDSLDTSKKQSWLNGGCPYDYGRYLKTEAGATKEKGGFYPNTVFVVGYNADSNKLHCEIRRYTPVADAEKSALNSCKRILGKDHAATCRTLKKM